MLAGFHEVTYTEGTKAAYEDRRALLESQGKKRTQWRVSSTMFTQFRHNVCVGPLPELSHLYTQQDCARYPKMSAFEILMQELNATNMVGQDV